MSTFLSHSLFYKSQLGTRYSLVVGFSLVALFAVQTCTGVGALFAYNNWTPLFSCLHSLNASLLVLLCLFHVYKNIYVNLNLGLSRNYSILSGWVVFVCLLLVCFSGYMIPWGQVSYWGAQVVTNILEMFPLVGGRLRQGVIGGPWLSEETTCSRFKNLHVILGLCIWVLVCVHLGLVHSKRSVASPVTSVMENSRSSFLFPYIVIKDSFILLGILVVSVYIFFELRFLAEDPGNNVPANPAITPLHVLPAWYFLPCFCALKYTSNKYAGVFCSIFVLNSVFLFFLLKSRI